MTTYLVTRHEGTRLWASIMARHKRLPFVIDHVMDHIDPTRLAKGDVVVGTLPVHMAAALHARGIKFWSLDIDTPPSERGKELTGVQLVKYNARFTRYEVRAKEVEQVAGARAAAVRKVQPSLTLVPVSEALMPAAIGYLHAPTEQICLLATAAMKKRAGELKRWLEARDPAPRVAVFDWDDASYVTLLEQAESWADKLVQEDRPRVVVNLTGGTKLMSMALQRAFGKRAEAFGERLESAYLDTGHGHIEDLLAPERAVTPMRSVLNLAEQLALQGFKVRHAASAAPGYPRWLERQELFDLLLKPQSAGWLPAWYALLEGADWLVNPRRNRRGERQRQSRFATVDWQGSREEPTFVIQVADPRDPGWKALQRALEGRFGTCLDGLNIAKVAALHAQGLTATFSRHPLDELAFVTGTWLEAWLALQCAKAGADEWAQGVTVRRDKVMNEFDLIVASGNRMLLIEAKTGRLDREGKEDTKASEAVYKLDAISEQIARSFGQRWLVSLRPLDPADRARAVKHGIRIFGPGGEKDHQGLADLPDALSAWVKKTGLPQDAGFSASAFAAPLPVLQEHERQKR